MAAVLSQLKQTIAVLAGGDTEDYASDLRNGRYLGGHNRDVSAEHTLGDTSGMPMC